MSFARTIETVPARVVVDGATVETLRVAPGTELKRITIGEGCFHFMAKIAGQWIALETDADLPAFTDKGRAQREKPRRPRGRPMRGKSSTLGVQPVAVRLDEQQRAWVRARAEAQHLTVSEYIRNLLSADGLPA